VKVGDNHSVRINMTVNALLQGGIYDKAGSLGTLKVQELDYSISDTTTKSVTLDKRMWWSCFRAAGVVTVQDLVDAIKEMGYDKYDFQSNGSGCRFWVITVLKLFKKKRFVGDITEAVKALQYAWDDNKKCLSKNCSAKPVCGTFHPSAAPG
jgi:hypothetical protein